MSGEAIIRRRAPAFGWIDLAVIGLLSGFIYALSTVARQWTGPLQFVPEIHLEARYLPLYALLSLTRGLLAYALSFVFTLAYGYTMARVAGAERVMLPLLDILQSIPVLGFLPGFVLGLVHLFPRQNFGLEIASVLMIFTGQVWNLTFSFYASLKSIPPDLLAVARLVRMSWWERFLRLDLSFAAPGLLWNSMMSMAGGWFFLMVSEAFVLGDHDFRLPGLGSYMSVAIERHDRWAQAFGILTMLGLIALLDQVVWRPLVGWSRRFTEEDAVGLTDSWVWTRVRRSGLWRTGARMVRFVRGRPRSRRRALDLAGRRLAPGRVAGAGSALSHVWTPAARAWSGRALLALVGVGVLVGASKYFLLVMTLAGAEWGRLLASTLRTLARVVIAVTLATAWAIPVGVLIGRHPRWSRQLQPVIQMAASFPAPMIFPLVVGGMLALGIHLGGSSVVLLMLATQWYILFNVIAGSSAIPRDLWEVARLSGLSSFGRWRRLILPAIFPSLLTGWITAMGGGWNASVVAEYLRYDGHTVQTAGLGAAISQATERGDFATLAAAVGLMAATVVLFNRVVWRPLTERARLHFALEL